MPARKKNKALIYLRRSSNRQEISLGAQLEWALAQAAKYELAVDATSEDLAHMQATGLHSYKSIRLDDSITGADMQRPGFLALMNEAQVDRAVSHILAYRRDRLARPHDAMGMANTELDIRKLGVTLVFSTGEAKPLERGDVKLHDELLLHLEYFENGDFLRQLAERVIVALVKIAKDGNWTGGQAPHGFIRILVNSNGEEVMELPPGRQASEKGCRVRIKPKDSAKIMVWLMILDLKEQGWGGKRIAHHLNGLGIPSPHAGRTRRDHGVEHVVSGKWSPGTVNAIAANSAIIGIQRFGRRSEGAHRRMSEDGPRVLIESDFSSADRPKVIQNAENVVIPVQMGYGPLVDVERWERIQADTRARGAPQRGIPRARDPAKYPLSCRVVDMTDGCGSIMHGRTSGSRPLYVCGRYMNSGCQQCENNTVDAEALLKFFLEQLAHFSRQPGNREQLRQLLVSRAQSQAGRCNQAGEGLSAELRARRATVAADYEVVGDNMAKERNDVRREFMGKTFDRLASELAAIDEQLAICERSQALIPSIEREVERALQLLDQIRNIIADPSARTRIPLLLKEMGVWIGLNFDWEIKGTKRRVRKVTGGVMTFGNAPLPVALHGQDRMPENSAGQQISQHPGQRSLPIEEVLRLPAPGAMYGQLGGASAPPAGPPGASFCHQEGVSCSKDNRGDRI